MKLYDKYDKIIKCDLVTYYPDTQKICRRIPNCFILTGEDIDEELEVDLSAPMLYVLYKANFKKENCEVVAYVSSLADVINFCKENTRTKYIPDKALRENGFLYVGIDFKDLIDFNLNYLGNEKEPVCFHSELNIPYSLCSGNGGEHCENCCFYNEFAPNAA